MIVLVLLSALLALTAAAPSGDSVESRDKELTAIRSLPALDHEEVHDEFGQYALRYVTAEGIVVCERGRLVPNNDGDGYVLITDGEFSYIGDDGEVYVTKFTAGLDGYHVKESEAVASEPFQASPTATIPEAFPANVDMIE